MTRELWGSWRQIFFIIALVFAVFHIYTAFAGFLPDLKQRSIHLMLGMVLSFLAVSYSKKGTETRPTWWDILLIGLVLAGNIHIFFSFERIHLSPLTYTTTDMVLGPIMILLSAELARRIYGWVVPILMFSTLALFFLGPYLPGIWRTPSLGYEYVMGQFYASISGLYGMLMGLSATLIAMFIIFGSLIVYTGAGDYFMDLSRRLTGKYSGGPAKMAVVASTLFGTISGSAVANTTVTGNYTIPLMKKTGYEPHFAGGVEAISSSGGMITPPIMGAGAFILSEITGVPYIKVCFHAVFPCLLFYIGVMGGVHLRALALGLKGLPEADLPPWKSVLDLRRAMPLAIPVVLLVFLLLQGWSITYSGSIACLATLGIFGLFGVPAGFSIQNIKQRIFNIGKALSDGGSSLARLIPLMATISIIIKALALSGATVKLSGLITDIGQANLVLGLLVAALVPLLLGMAIPPVAAYVLAAAVVAPSLTSIGINFLAAHLFVFYMSCLAPFTPPICAAAFVAGNIAGANWLKVAFVSMRLGFPIYLIPFLMIMSPALIGMGDPLQIFFTFVISAIGILFASMGFFGHSFFGQLPAGWLGVFVRVLTLTGGILMLFPQQQVSILGIILCAVVTVFCFKDRLLAAWLRR